jgi:hypothetical protein
MDVDGKAVVELLPRLAGLGVEPIGDAQVARAVGDHWERNNAPWGIRRLSRYQAQFCQVPIRHSCTGVDKPPAATTAGQDNPNGHTYGQGKLKMHSEPFIRNVFRGCTSRVRALRPLDPEQGNAG